MNAPELMLEGEFPADYKPGGVTSCVTIYLYLEEDPGNDDACTLVTGFELQNFSGDQELYLAMGSGRTEMNGDLSGAVEPVQVLGCVDNGDVCDPLAAGGYNLAHLFVQAPAIEPGTWTEAGDTYEFYNDRSHVHGSLDREGCAPHLDWVLRRAE